jgi:hypothetical protein
MRLSWAVLLLARYFRPTVAVEGGIGRCRSSRIVGTMSDRPGAAEELVILLAAEPTAVAKLLDEHRGDSSGHCRICTAGRGGYQVWPCSIYAAAQRAAQILDAGAPR